MNFRGNKYTVHPHLAHHAELCMLGGKLLIDF